MKNNQNKTKNNLNEIEKRFHDIALCSVDWIWEVNSAGQYTYTSGNIEKILGYSAEEIIGKTPFDFMPKEEAQKVGEIFKKIVSEKKPIIDLENWNISKDGKKILLLTNGVPIIDSEGSLQGYRGVDKDITEQKKNEDLIRKSEGKYRSIFENSNDGIVNINLKTIITDINPAFGTISGYNHKDFIGKSCLKISFLTKKSVMLLSKKIAELAIEEKIEPFSIDFIAKDGTKKIVQISASRIEKDNKLLGFQAMIRDITKQKKTEEDLKKRVDELEKFHKVTVDRELKMIELKKEVERLKEKCEKSKK